jgi:hypothetical protein
MKTSSYWELSEQERGALTESEVEQYTDYELMRAGVVRVSPPDAPAKPDVPEPDEVLYRIEAPGHGSLDLAWRTPEAAEGALRGAAYLTRKYFGNYETSVHIVEDSEAKVVGVKAYSKTSYDAYRADLERHGEQVKLQKEQRERSPRGCSHTRRVHGAVQRLR